MAGSTISRLLIAITFFWVIGILYFARSDAVAGIQPKVVVDSPQVPSAVPQPPPPPLEHGSDARRDEPVVPSPPPPPAPHAPPAPRVSAAPVAASSVPRRPHRDWGNTAVVILAYNRPDYLKRTLDSLMALDGIDELSVYVSQDGRDPGVAEMARSFESRGVTLIQREHILRGHEHNAGTAFLAQHYQDCLTRLFNDRRHDLVILLEDDMVFSPDFITYFKQTSVLLEVDPSIFCVSSWNDNGFENLDLDARKLFRTSFFPGLGWMLHRELWNELKPKWPGDHWDHWMRLSTTHRGRQCVSPELSRNFNIGEKGATVQSATYNQFLKRIAYNTEPNVDLGDLSYLLRDQYELFVRDVVAHAQHLKSPPHGAWTVAKFEQAVAELSPSQPVLITYFREEWKPLATTFTLFPNPRGHFQHTTIIRFHGRFIILCNARQSPHLPDTLRVDAPANMRTIKAERDQSCDDACGNAGGTCDVKSFEFINSCEVLAKHFACERGCKLEVGPDVPNYVPDSKDWNYQRCLISNEESPCKAHHRSTQRICACVV